MSRNEKKTEKLTRNFFEKVKIYNNPDFIFEEQISDNPVIQKLLKKSSKSGDGTGKPEFIIRKRDGNEFLIVVECKPDIKHHESKERNKPRDYAVDGVLLYSEYLSRGFNVISVAISGEDNDNYKISTFFQPKGGSNANSLLDENKVILSEIITWDRYIKLATFDEELITVQYRDLKRFSRELHEYLRDYAKITEAQKPLLVSGILLALMEQWFEKSYIALDGEILAQKTFQAIKDYINSAKLGENQESKKKAIENSFSFIEHHPELQKIDLKKNESPLKHLIQELHTHVRPFTKDHYDFDIIGDFYGEFVRYTGGDKQGLGIVLTPKHITELFADIAKVNKNSTVLDICAGTASFLISSMNKMIKSKNVSAEEKVKILEHQLIGVEQEPSMFALAVSNMILRGDGKTNLYQGDSLKDQHIIEKIKDKADTGFINPPYSQKGEDVSEWHFIFQMLNLLKTKGTGIAIVPMALAIDTKNLMREKILKNHRLEAVMSMPDDLFYPVGVVTCIMVFSAHIPHNSDENHKSWFGYWKNDGFKKDKVLGRVPSSEQTWEEIKKSWVDMFRQKEVAGKSVWKNVEIEDEWCAEAYLETDYSDLSDSMFVDLILKFASFDFKNGNPEMIELMLLKKRNKRSLNEKKWNWFCYNDLFDIKIGKSIDLNKLEQTTESDGISYVGRTEENNGITSKVKNNGNFEINKGDCITVPMVGNELKSSYQENDFCVSQNIAILRMKNKIKLNKYIAVFLGVVFRKDTFRFAYGRTLSLDRLKKLKIKLPVDDKGNPDWQFMEDYIRSLPYPKNN